MGYWIFMLIASVVDPDPKAYDQHVFGLCRIRIRNFFMDPDPSIIN
jgi:hypothetical protein